MTEQLPSMTNPRSMRYVIGLTHLKKREPRAATACKSDSALSAAAAPEALLQPCCIPLLKSSSSFSPNLSGSYNYGSKRAICLICLSSRFSHADGSFLDPTAWLCRETLNPTALLFREAHVLSCCEQLEH